MKYFIVDAFTGEPFGGNPAGVVFLGDNVQFPSDKLMQQIAAEFRYSETAFVLQNGPNEFTVRYFTPASEVDLCGHATIATFGVLKNENIVVENTLCLNHTFAGDLQVRVGDNIMMEMAPARVIDAVIDIDRLYNIMHAKPINKRLPVLVVSTGLPDIIMPVNSIEELHSLNPDMNALAQISKELGVTGVHAFAIGNDDYTAHVRNFGPLYGIPEESATGTANAALTHYLYNNGIITDAVKCNFLQGEAMGRPSIVSTIIEKNGDIWVGGNICIIASGKILV